MSRRIKLTIAALFLAFLAVLTVHLLLTWSPAQPLTFRVVEQHIDPVKGAPSRVVVLDMVNHSRVAIYVGAGFLTSGVGEKGASDVEDVRQRDTYYPKVQGYHPDKFPLLGHFISPTASAHPRAPTHIPQHDPLLIRPGETVRYEVQIPADHLPAAREDDMYVCYSWVSTTRYSFVEFQHNLRRLFQDISLRGPFLEILEHNMSPIEMPPTVLPAPGKP